MDLHLRVEKARAIAAAAGLFQTTDPKRAGKRLPLVLRALARGDLAGAEKRLLVIESGAGVHRFRRRLATAHLPDDVVLATATLLAASAAKDLDRQGRVELLLRRLLVVHGSEGEQVVGRDHADAILDTVSGGTVAPASVKDRALSFFQDALVKLHECTTVEEVFSNWVLADVLGFKATLGADFRDPDLLYASIVFSVEVENRLAFLSMSDGDSKAGDVSYRLWKMELELRTMFRRASESDRAQFEVGAFEKIDWRRFKWRQGLVRLNEKKTEKATRIMLRRRTLLLVLLALLIVGLAPKLIPEEGTLHVPELDLATVSPLLKSAIANDSAMVFAADSSVWNGMGDTAREREAATIASRLSDSGVRAALVQVDGALIIRIEAGSAVYVAHQPRKQPQAVPQGGV